MKHIRDEIDRFLRDKGYNGFMALAECIEKAISEGRVRTGELKTAHYTFYKGYWLIDKEITKNQREITKCLGWFACTEMGVPEGLRKRFLEEMDTDVEEFIKQKGMGKDFPH